MAFIAGERSVVRGLPGRTRRAPVIGAAKTKPHELAWNKGTRAQMQLVLPSFITSVEAAIRA